MNEKQITSSFFKRIEEEINFYLTQQVEIAPEVYFSQYKTIKRNYKFKNKATNQSKLKDDLTYDFYFDIISRRVDDQVKNMRFDSKNLLVFSTNPREDFAAVFIANTQLKTWLSESGEDEKLKAAVEQFVEDGNVGFKKVAGGYEFVDPLNTIITNQTAEHVDETDIIERHEMTASKLRSMEGWDVDHVIKNLGNKSFTSSVGDVKDNESSKKSYEIWEFSGEMSEKEYFELKGEKDGDENKYLISKVIMAGLNKSHDGSKYVLFAESYPTKEKLSDNYIYAHKGSYKGRFYRPGLVEELIDHQIRANDIGNQIASALDWSSKVIFKSSDSSIMQNIRTDMENGDIITAKDINQLEVRSQGADQLIADWNRLMQDADGVSKTYEVVTGEALPSGTPFRMGMLLDQNAGKYFTTLRQKLTLPFRRVFKNWVLPELVSDLKGEDIFRLVGDTEVIDQFRSIVVDSWYMENLVKIGPHNREQGEAIKQEKLDELRNVDPVIENSKEIWKSVLPRMLITITGENSDVQDQLQDLINLIGLEQDPERISWILNTIYRSRNIPIPPVVKEELPDNAAANAGITTPDMQAAQQVA